MPVHATDPAPTSAGTETDEVTVTQEAGTYPNVVSLATRARLRRSEALVDLLADGDERGLVRLTEVREAVVEHDEALDTVPVLVKQLRRAGVVVVDDVADEAARERGAFTADGVRLYLNEIGRVDLLDAELEANLAKRIEAGLGAAQMLDNPELPLEPGQRAMLRRVERDGCAAKDHLIESNLRLVVSLAKRYLGSGLPMSDLVQEGNLGLMRAVDKFDATKGYKFSTYATWWIRQMISRAIADQSRTIRLPVHLFDTINRIKRAERALATALGHEPTVEEVAEQMGMTPEKVAQLKGFATAMTSLDTPLGEDADTSIGDLLEDPSAVVPLDAVASLLLHDDVEEVLGRLPDRERRVLELRFGLAGQPPKTLEQVGSVLGLTRERIRQIEARGLARLRHPSNLAALDGYLD